jgi:hypothetical protein
MKFTELTIKQVLSIACPTCGVAAGQQCIRHSGGEPRVEPHIARKISADQAMKKKFNLESE